MPGLRCPLGPYHKQTCLGNLSLSLGWRKKRDSSGARFWWNGITSPAGLVHSSMTETLFIHQAYWIARHLVCAPLSCAFLYSM